MAGLISNKDMMAIWRVGLVAYRDACRKRLDRDVCDRIGTVAIKDAFPQLTWQRARQQLAEAVAWASINHHAWLHLGVPHREWIWPPDHRGVGYKRNPGYEDVWTY